jgi:hypothetical protein
MAIVSLETAMAHLHLNLDGDGSPNPYESDVQLKLHQATAIVLMHIKRHEYADWSEDTDPATDPEYALASAAILKVLGNLWKFRGDDAQTPGAVEGPLTPDIVLLLSGMRDPTIA